MKSAFALFVSTLAAAAYAQPSPCGSPASGVYAVVAMQAESSPLHSEADFATLQKTLDFYCFKKTTTGWSFAGATAEVVVIHRGSLLSILLLPYTPSRFGDAALAALISRAAHISTSDGDAINLAFPPRAVTAAGAEGSVTEQLGFRLDAGTWFRTSTTVEWNLPRAAR